MHGARGPYVLSTYAGTTHATLRSRNTYDTDFRRTDRNTPVRVVHATIHVTTWPWHDGYFEVCNVEADCRALGIHTSHATTAFTGYSCTHTHAADTTK